MRTLFAVFILAVSAASQASASPQAATLSTQTPVVKPLIVPAGTKVPISLKHAINTKSAREGDSVYAETTFPVVQDNHVLIPAGTYVQGKISNVKRAGRVKGRAEILIHFTTLIYPSGYTVLLPGSVENVPGADKTSVKDQEGTIRQDSQTGEKVGTVATSAGTGAVVGGLSRGGKGAAIGAGIGGAAGAAIAMLSRGNDVKLDAGTTIEMVIQRAVELDPTRVGTNNSSK